MNRNLLIVVVLLLLSSCTVYKEYQIEVYQPGVVAVPPNAESVALVYRNFKYPNDTLLHYYSDDHILKKAKTDPENLDSILTNLCMQELAKNLKSKGQLQTIHIFPELFKEHRAAKLPALDFKMVGNITESTHSDLLISLETYSTFYSEYPPSQEIPAKSNEAITAAVWAVYNPQTQKLLDRKTMIDTVFWNGYDESGRYNRKALLPPRITALKIAAQMAGENYAKRFFSSWQTANRMYSIPPLPEFDAADRYVQKGEWDNAIMLWMRYASDDAGRTAIHARYNLAFGYEMKDELETALRWLIAAQQIATKYRSKKDLTRIIYYESALKKRLLDRQRLNADQ